jgi:hypothetical protein
VGAIGSGIKADQGYPFVYQASVLPPAEMAQRVKAARKQVFGWMIAAELQPGMN